MLSALPAGNTVLALARHTKPMLRIDAHHHLWRYNREDYDWIDDTLSPLRRDFLPSDLAAALHEAGVSAAVAVQARQTLAETRFLLDAATATPAISGVVGWFPLRDPSLEEVLQPFLVHRKLKGARHVVQAEAEGFLLSDEFNRGVRALTDAGLVYDVLIHAPQLRETLAFVDRHPEQSFVLDHLAKPGIRAGQIRPWANDLGELARRPHVTCKISGMVTEADPEDWSAEQLHPYFEVALEAFGADRLMAGSDWPVLTVGCTYSHWWDVLASWVKPLSLPEQAAILGGTAQRVYSLTLPQGVS